MSAALDAVLVDMIGAVVPALDGVAVAVHEQPLGNGEGVADGLHEFKARVPPSVGEDGEEAFGSAREGFTGSRKSRRRWFPSRHNG